MNDSVWVPGAGKAPHQTLSIIERVALLEEGCLRVGLALERTPTEFLDAYPNDPIHESLTLRERLVVHPLHAPLEPRMPGEETASNGLSLDHTRVCAGRWWAVVVAAHHPDRAWSEYHFRAFHLYAQGDLRPAFVYQTHRTGMRPIDHLAEPDEAGQHFSRAPRNFSFANKCILFDSAETEPWIADLRILLGPGSVVQTRIDGDSGIPLALDFPDYERHRDYVLQVVEPRGFERLRDLRDGM